MMRRFFGSLRVEAITRVSRLLFRNRFETLPKQYWWNV